MRFLPSGLVHRRPFLIASAAVVLGAPSAWLLAGNTATDDTSVVARAKRGTFTVTVTTSGELRARQFVQITVPSGGQPLREADLSGPLGWLFGAEGAGVSSELQARAAARITIPLAEGSESLNVAATAAICLYAAFRS